MRPGKHPLLMALLLILASPTVQAERSGAAVKVRRSLAKHSPSRLGKVLLRYQRAVNLQRRGNESLQSRFDWDMSHAFNRERVGYAVERLPQAVRQGLEVPPERIAGRGGLFGLRRTKINPAVAEGYKELRKEVARRLKTGEKQQRYGELRSGLHLLREALTEKLDGRFVDGDAPWKKKVEEKSTSALLKEVTNYFQHISGGALTSEVIKHDGGKIDVSNYYSRKTLLTKTGSGSRYAVDIKAPEFRTRDFRFLLSSEASVPQGAIAPETARTYLQYLLRIQHIGRVLQNRANSLTGRSSTQDERVATKEAAAKVSRWINGSQMTIEYHDPRRESPAVKTLQTRRALSDAVKAFGESGMISSKLSRQLNDLHKKARQEALDGLD